MPNIERFSLRRAVERLRDGLFDPVAVDRLTVEKHRIENVFSKGLEAIKKGQSDHLCICGLMGRENHTH